MQRSDGLFSALAEVSRRDFMKLCTALAATMGLSSKAGAEMTAALTEPKRPPVLWIGAQEKQKIIHHFVAYNHSKLARYLYG